MLSGTDFNELGWLLVFDKALKIDNVDSLNKFQVDLCNRSSYTVAVFAEKLLKHFDKV